MTFNGWPEVALDFYEGLEADNSRTYWTAHKAIYESAVLQPMAELTADLEPPMRRAATWSGLSDR